MNLVIALLSTRTFITAERIRETVYGYADSASDEAFSRMFERDKNELRDLGIPLETGRVSQFDPTEGYRINRDAYALPAVELTADEAAAVAVATQLWESPELITATQGALLKLRAAGVDVDAADSGIAITSTAALPGLRGSEDVLGILLSAIDSGQAVQFPHRPSRSDPYTTRTVEPWGVVTDRGRWYLVGHDRDRDATRTFRLSRIGADVTPIGPRRRGEAPRRGRPARDRRTARSASAPHRRQARVWVADGRATALRRRATVVGPRALGGRAGEEISVDIGMSDRLAREIASYGAGRHRARTAITARRRAGPASRAGRPERRGQRMTAVSTRLVRLLNMVPYFQANPRITYAEAATDLGVSVKQLRDDLNQLWMCGLPGYGPGDLIDFEFSGDTIEVTFSAGIDHPLRLTSPEATGVLVALRALLDVPGMVDPEAARSAIAKIESAAGTVGQASRGRRRRTRARGKRGRRRGPRCRARRPRAGDRVLLGLPRHADQQSRRPDPRGAGRRPQLPGGVVPVGRGSAAVPVRPHRRRPGARRAVGSARRPPCRPVRTPRCSMRTRRCRRRRC